MVDDLITSSKSKLDAIEILVGVGLKVNDVVVLLDRQEGGKEELEKRGVRLHAAVTADQVFEVIFSSNLLSPMAVEICELYRRKELTVGWQDSLPKGWDRIAA